MILPIAIAIGAAGLHIARTKIGKLRMTQRWRGLAPRAILAGMDLRAAFVLSTDHWHPLDTAPSPAIANNPVPIVPMRFDPIVPEQRDANGRNQKWYTTRERYLALKSAVKAGLAASGRGDEDWRCVVYRWADETLWGVSCVNGNIGNIHYKPYATPDSIRQGTVYLDPAVTPGATGAVVLTDDGQVVVELAFDTLTDWLRYEKAWYLRNHYDGVIAGYQQGGLGGLLLASETAMRRGYSAAGTVADDAHKCRMFWGAPEGEDRPWSGAKILGADWAR